ncbi:MAG: tetratricopeptide repeat protein [Patescibacteria group bacterium]|jgi:tetratricopeptide (TPR) repeat protein
MDTTPETAITFTKNRLLRFSGLVLLVVVLSLPVFFSIFKINDADTVFYLAGGKQLLNKGFSEQCFFSYASATCQHGYNEWLTYVTTYVTYLAGGWNALVMLQVGIVLAIWLLLLVYHRIRSYRLFTSITVLTIASFIAMERFMLRADLFGLLFAVLIFISVSLSLKRIKQKRQGAWRFALLAIMSQLFWTNMHGSFPLGWLITGAFLAEELYQIVWRHWRAQEPIKITQPLIYTLKIFLASLVVSVMNPFGISALFWPFQFYFGTAEFHDQLEFLSPFASLNFLTFSVHVYQIAAFVVSLLLLARWKKISLRDVIILGSFFYLSTTAIRYIALFAVFAALITPTYIDDAITVLTQWVKKTITIPRLLPLIVKGAFVVGFLFIVGRTEVALANNRFYTNEMRSRRFGLGLSELDYPIGATNFILNQQLTGNIFNDYASGAYLDWGLYPAHQTFIDGDTYTLDLLKQYRDIVAGAIPYQTIVEQYNINYFLLSFTHDDTAPLIASLAKDIAWTPVYFDETSIFYARKIPGNQKLIDTYSIDFASGKNFDHATLPTFREPTNTAIGYGARGSFFATIGFFDLAYDQFERAVSADSENALAQFGLARIADKLNKSEEAEAAYRKAYELMPSYANIHYYLGLHYYSLNSYDKAANEFKRTLAINSNYPEAHYYLGLTNEAQGNVTDAIQEYKKELSVNADSEEGRDALRRLNQPSLPAGNAQPTNNTSSASEQKLQDAKVKFDLGVTLGQEKNFTEAAKAFESSIALSPLSATAHFNLGNTYYWLGRYSDAARELEQGVSIDPSQTQMYLNLGSLYANQLHDSTKAVASWKKFIELAPNDPASAGVRQQIEAATKK